MGGEVVFHFFGCCYCCGYTIGLRDALHLKMVKYLVSINNKGIGLRDGKKSSSSKESQRSFEEAKHEAPVSE